METWQIFCSALSYAHWAFKVNPALTNQTEAFLRSSLPTVFSPYCVPCVSAPVCGIQYSVLWVRISDPEESSYDLRSRAQASMRLLYAATETLILPSCSQGTESKDAGLAPVQGWCHGLHIAEVLECPTWNPQRRQGTSRDVRLYREMFFGFFFPPSFFLFPSPVWFKWRLVKKYRAFLW